MKAIKIALPLFTCGVLFSGIAFAASAEVMDPAEAHSTATKARQVTYSCSKGGQIKVAYGFNKQNLPTYAEANLGGKTRFLPINLKHSDIAGTSFGDGNSWTISSEALTLNNYHKSNVLIMDSNSEIHYKNCRAIGTKKLKVS